MKGSPIVTDLSAEALTATSSTHPATPSNVDLQIAGASVRFGSVQALSGVTFTVPEGRPTAVIGPNGSGKSTLINAIMGEVRLVAGSIRLGGRTLNGCKPYQIAALGVARTYQTSRPFMTMTAAENLEIALRLSEGAARARNGVPVSTMTVDELLDAFRLSHLQNVQARALSHGHRRLLEIAMSCTTEPRYLLLDEPTAGITKSEKSLIVDLLSALCAKATLVLIEHDFDVVFELASWIVVLDRGSVLFEGKPAAVRANPQVRLAYFGDIDG